MKIHGYKVGGPKEQARCEARLRKGETGQLLVGIRGVRASLCFYLKREHVYPGEAYIRVCIPQRSIQSDVYLGGKAVRGLE